MGYEGHAVGLSDRSLREQQTAEAMELLCRAHADVGGDVVSAGVPERMTSTPGPLRSRRDPMR
jgi:hypothetical protein